MIGHPDGPLAAGWRGLPAGGRVAGVGMGDQAVLSGREPGRFNETVRAWVPSAGCGGVVWLPPIRRSTPRSCTRSAAWWVSRDDVLVEARGVAERRGASRRHRRAGGVARRRLLGPVLEGLMRYEATATAHGSELVCAEPECLAGGHNRDSIQKRALTPLGVLYRYA